MAAKFEIRSPKAGQYQWVLVSQGRTLATGPSFARRGMAEKSIASFRMAAIAAPVDDQTPTRGKAAPANAVPAKAARATGRAVGTAVGTGGRAVEKFEKAAKRVARKAARAIEDIAPAPKKTGGRKRTAKG